MQVHYPNQQAPVVQQTAAMRGSPGGGAGFKGAVHLSGGGIGIPPPAAGFGPTRGNRGRGGPRGGNTSRGARGGASNVVVEG